MGSDSHPAHVVIVKQTWVKITTEFLVLLEQPVMKR